MSTIFSNRIHKGARRLAFALFLIYLIFLAYLLFLSPAFGRNAAVVREYNLIPLKTIKNYIKYREYVNSQTLFLNIIGNILAFIPMGFFIPIIFRNKRHLMEVFFFSSIISLSVEFLQYRFVVGSFDVDDILLNTAGGMLGYMIFLMIYRNYRKIRNKKRSKQ